MPTISPSSIQLEPNQTQQFTQSGIGSPVWSVFGAGTINQSGLFTAQSVSSIVIAHEPAWASVNLSAWTQQADDSLVSNGSLDYFGSAVSKGKLNAVGDWCAAKLPYRAGYSPNKWGILNIANTVGVYLQYGLSIVEVATGYSLTTSLSATANDIFEFRVNSNGKIEVRQNGNLIFTSVNSFTGLSLPFYTSCDYASGVVQTVPRFNASNSNYTSVEAVATVLPLILLTRTALELYCESNTLSLTDNAAVSSFADLSGKGRNLTASTNQPVFKTSDSRIQWNGSQAALKNTASFQLNCGFILAKYDSATFADYNGLLSDCGDIGIIAGNTGGNTLFNFAHSLYEFRSNDRIYPSSFAPGPMNNFKLLFFKFWTPIQVNGIQIGDDRNFPSRKWNGSVKLVALYSRHFCENEIREMAETIAESYSLAIADVYAYQADAGNTPEKPIQTVNFYDPPEGDRISETLSNLQRSLELNFSAADQEEVKYMKAFYKSHYAQALPFIYRDYRFTPPEDIEGYLDSPYNLDGANNNWSYSFTLKDKG
jgi:hypothetical protein